MSVWVRLKVTVKVKAIACSLKRHYGIVTYGRSENLDLPPLRNVQERF